MKKSKITLITLLLATLAVGCSKDETTVVPTNVPGNEQVKAPLRLFANAIANSGSKVSFDVTGDGEHPFAANWVDDEWVMLNGTNYKVAWSNDNGGYYGLKDNNGNFISPVPEGMHALYPGQSFGDNEVEISSNGKEIILHRLGIHFVGATSDTQSTAFPMVANAAADTQYLYFDHLSCGVQLRLKNNGSAVNIASLTIVAQSTTDVENLGINDTIARWAVEGPWLPMGPVGTNGDDVDVKFSSVMNFDFSDDNGHSYKTINNGQTLKFCVPITISSVRYLKVTGYDENGNVLFYKKKDFVIPVDVERNRMYTFPIIEF